MKLQVTESQLKLIEQQLKLIMSEQPDSRFPVYGLTDDERRKVDYGSELEQKVTLGLMEIGSTFLPIVGPFLGALQGAYYADQEYSKGNKKTGVVIGILSILPFVNQIRSFIPGLKTIGQEGLINLGNKLSGVIKTPLTPIEKEIVNGLNKSIPTIEQNINRIQDAIKNTVDYKGQYIKTYGKIKFQDLFNKLIKGDITKQQYIDELVGGLKDTYKLAKWSVNAGIKFEEFEMDQMTKILPDIQKGVESARRILLDVKGELKSVQVIIKKFPNASFGGKMIDGDKILMNIEKLSGKSIDEIGEILSHEAAHVKDPSLVSHVYRDTYNATRKLVDVAGKKFDDLATATEKTGQGISNAVKAGEEFTKAFTKYVFHPQEITANNQMVLNNITKKITDVVSNVGAKGAKQTLNNVINFVSGKSSLDDAAKQLLGKNGIEHLNGLYNYSKSEYQELLKKIAKQSDYLKDQLNLLIQ